MRSCRRFCFLVVLICCAALLAPAAIVRGRAHVPPQAEFIEVCAGPPGRADRQRTVRLPRQAAEKKIAKGLATLGACELEGILAEVEEARILNSQEAEDTSLRFLEKTHCPACEDIAAGRPPLPRVMGACIDAKYAQETEVGYAYSIFQGGSHAFSGAGGSARAPWEVDAPDVAMTPDTRMTIASVSKALTAVAVMRLIQENGIGLDTPFYDLVEESFIQGPVFFAEGEIGFIPGPGVENVTIQNLLQHRSGLKTGLGCGKLEKILAIGTVGQPGVTYDYENSNFCFLRKVIEAETGMDYVDYVTSQVLAPAGVVDMSCEPDAVEPALYYNTIESPGFLWGGYTNSCSAYGWYASARALGSFLGILRSAAVLTDITKDTMFTTCGANDYCLGWITKDDGIGMHSYHNGDWIDGNPCDDVDQCKRGYNGTVMRLAQGIDAALLVNTRGGTGVNPGLKSEVTILRECFAEAFVDANPPPP